MSQKAGSWTPEGHPEDGLGRMSNSQVESAHTRAPPRDDIKQHSRTAQIENTTNKVLKHSTPFNIRVLLSCHRMNSQRSIEDT